MKTRKKARLVVTPCKAPLTVAATALNHRRARATADGRQAPAFVELRGRRPA